MYQRAGPSNVFHASNFERSQKQVEVLLRKYKRFSLFPKREFCEMVYSFSGVFPEWLTHLNMSALSSPDWLFSTLEVKLSGWGCIVTLSLPRNFCINLINNVGPNCMGVKLGL